MPETEAPRWLTTSEVAERVKLTEARVRALVRAGDIPAYRIGDRGSYRIHPQDIDRALGYKP